MPRTLIVGGGLIGSAAARHLSDFGDDVVLIAPSEPADRHTHDGVFASHYDEGRITRILDPDPAWSITAARSIARYGDLQEDTGIRFFEPVGFLHLSSKESESLAQSSVVGRAHGANFETLDSDDLRQRFPFLAVEDGDKGLHEHETAGYISPRAMVTAQIAATKANGATVVDSPAVRVTVTGSGVEVETGDGDVLTGDRTLIAAGGFTNAWNLVPSPLDLRVYARTTVLLPVAGDVLAGLETMPSIVDGVSGAYLLPPIRYPDGRHYVKIGIGTNADERLKTAADLDAWFKGPGSQANRDEFTDLITTMIPSLSGIDAIHTDTCVTTYTISGLPMIDFVDEDDRVAVAVAGNGKGAKSSDDWGYAAALLLSGRDWDHPIERVRLGAVFL